MCHDPIFSLRNIEKGGSAKPLGSNGMEIPEVVGDGGCCG